MDIVEIEYVLNTGVFLPVGYVFLVTHIRLWGVFVLLESEDA